MRRVVALALAILAAPLAATAAWSPTGSGQGAAAARTMPAGNVPTGSALLGTVSLSWAASSFSGGPAVGGYVVRRYHGITGAEGAVLANCAGIVTGLSCTENGVSVGTWKYTITPAHGSWRGAQSAQSSAILVL